MHTAGDKSQSEHVAGSGITFLLCRGDGKCHISARELSREELTARLADASCKIVDFGNACWTYKQFTSDIQTRQYRCPEV
jgi:hypothetical protein